MGRQLRAFISTPHPPAQKQRRSLAFIQVIAANICVFLGEKKRARAGNLTIKAAVDLREKLGDQLVYWPGIRLHLQRAGRGRNDSPGQLLV